MKVLFITTDRYPYFGTSTGILKKLFFEGKMLQHVDSITVLTEKHKEDEKKYEIIDNVSVIRYISAYSMKMNCILKDSTINLFQKVCHLVKKIQKKYITKNSKDLLRQKHIKEIYKSLVDIKAEQYDVIIPIFGDYDAAVATIKFKCDSPSTRVVLYQVDPFSTNWVADKGFVSKYRRIEKWLYSSADAIITMPCIYKDVKDISNKEDLYKFNLLELPLVYKREYMVKYKENNRPICLFSGLIYKNIRDPKYTIKLFQKLIEDNVVELWFAGVEYDELPVEFKGIDIKCFGIVPITEANSLIEQADILINIGNLMNNQVPSKIFDYISTGKPIINICKNYDCPTLQYLKDYSLCLNIFEDNNCLFSQQSKLREFVISNKNKRIPFDQIEEKYKECTPLICSEKIQNILSEITK